MKSALNTKRWLCPIGLILLIGASHALLLLNRGLYQDDWLILSALQADDAIAWRFLLDAGHPLFLQYYKAVWEAGHSIFTFKLTVWVAAICGAYYLYQSAPRLFGVTPREAFWLTTITWIYPGYMLWPVITTGAYVVATTLFFAGWFALLSSPERVGATRRLVVGTLFLLSFSLNGLLVVFYAFVVCAVLTETAHTDGIRVRAFFVSMADSLRKFVVRSPELIALPAIYWLSLNALFPRAGEYASHYAFKWDVGIWIDGAHAFAAQGLINPLAQAYGAVQRNPLSGMFPLLAGIASYALAGRIPEVEVPPETRGGPGRVLLQVTVVLLACVGPYLLIGQAPSLHYYDSRHLLLFGLPVGIFCVALGRCNESRAWHRAHQVFLIALVGVSVFVVQHYYLYLESHWARMMALRDRLRALPESAGIVFVSNPGFYPEGQALSQRQDYLGVFELSGILKDIRRPWALSFDQDRETRLVERLRIDETGALKSLAYYWPFRNLAPAGERCFVRAERSEHHRSNLRVGIQGLYYRYLHPEGENEFLRQLMHVEASCKSFIQETPFR